jgi:hypothetical protein
MNPYTDIECNDTFVIRVFDENIDPIELKWHRDRETRVIESIGETDWLIQIENSLPVTINTVRIEQGTWHRLIKGSKSLKLKIFKHEKV